MGKYRSRSFPEGLDYAALMCLRFAALENPVLRSNLIVAVQTMLTEVVVEETVQRLTEDGLLNVGVPPAPSWISERGMKALKEIDPQWAMFSL